MSGITRREWLERIRQQIIILSSMAIHLASDWYAMSDDEKEDHTEAVLAKVRNIATMVRGRGVFED